MQQPRSIFTGCLLDANIPPIAVHHQLSNSGPVANTTAFRISPFPPPTWTSKSPLDLCEDPRRPSPASRKSFQDSIWSGVKRPQPIHLASLPGGPAPPSEGTAREDSGEPLHKRPRLQSFSRPSFNRFGASQNLHFSSRDQPPSPLFFSSRNTSNTRPSLPARFSSSEAAARMLSKAREESAVKTVSLARGTFTGLSPPAPLSATSGRSSDRSSLPRTLSPDSKERFDPLKLLGSIGVVELLELDTRPTFIVDIGDGANYTPNESPTLQILFANNALRSNVSLWENVVGRPLDSASGDVSNHAANQFRGWLLGSEGVNLAESPSPVEHGGIIWSCSTLRKRFRIISGAVLSMPMSNMPSTSASNEFPIPSASSVGLASGNTKGTSSSSAPGIQQDDYFGNASNTRQYLEPTQASSTQQNNADPLSQGTSAVPEAIFRRPSKIDMPYSEASGPNAYGFVLSSHTAGDVDPFLRDNKDHPNDHDMGFFDWTRLSLSSSLPQHIQFARSVDWASTPLGPIEYWSNDLRAMCNLIMSVALIVHIGEY